MERELRVRVEARLDVAATSVVRVEEGWDSSVFEVNREWIVRVPRRDEVRGWVRKEAALLPVLAPSLPVPSTSGDASTSSSTTRASSATR